MATWRENGEDVLFLEGLEVPVRVGCTESERATRQSLRADIRMYCASLARAGATDDLSASVDYRVATEMIAAVQEREFNLIESVAEALASVALAQAVVDRVQVTLRKRPPVQGLEVAGVRITRSRP